MSIEHAESAPTSRIQRLATRNPTFLMAVVALSVSACGAPIPSGPATGELSLDDGQVLSFSSALLVDTERTEFVLLATDTMDCASPASLGPMVTITLGGNEDAVAMILPVGQDESESFGLDGATIDISVAADGARGTLSLDATSMSGAQAVVGTVDFDAPRCVLR